MIKIRLILNIFKSTKYFDGFAHGSLNVEGSNVLPSLLCQGDQEVNTHSDVLSELFFSLFHISDSSSQARGFLGLEFNGVLDFSDFVDELFSFSHGDGELSELDEDITQKLGGLLSNGVRCQENIIFLCPFFNFGLILVESLKSINVNVWDFLSSSFFNMDSIGEDTDLSYGFFLL